MEVSTLVWIATAIGIVGLLAFDFFFHVRKAHIPTIRESATWTAIYVSVAILFGLGLTLIAGRQHGLEYFAGYITELSLSVDNLFVFLIIMGSFKVPRAEQQKVLMFGIVVSLIFRTGFIFLGAALINSFAWVFYIFGLILLITAWNLVRPSKEGSEGSEGSEANNFIIRLAKRFMHTTDFYDEDKLFTVVDGRRAMTPMLLVMIAIGGTDVMFALDSIPAIFGLTQNTYIVFTAVAFSLLGLRQLYFLIDGLLDRLIYLTYGLAVILAFIGVKLILHALHENNLPFLNNGQPFHVWDVSTELSLVVILASLAVTVVLSLTSPRGKALTAINNTRRLALQYVNGAEDAAAGHDHLFDRDETFTRLVGLERAVVALPEKYQHLVSEETEMLDLLDDAHQLHAAYVAATPGTPPAPERPLDTASYRARRS